MKLIFPNGEHGQVELRADSVVTIGSDAGADVRLDVDGVAPGHARIQLTAQGASIAVDNAANVTRVNGSLVVARTPLKGGDALLFGKVQCQLAGQIPVAEKLDLPDPKPSSKPEPADTTVRRAVPQFLLRGVSGSTFGKHFPLYGTTVIGRHSDCDVCLPSDEISRRHARVTVATDGLYVEDLDSANGTFVNGRRVRREKIEPGDELKLDTVRFLVQSPGGNEAPKSAGKSPEQAAATGGGSAKWIAIGVFVVIAAAVGLKVAGVY